MLQKTRSYYNCLLMTVPNFSAVRALIFDLDGTLIDSKLDLIRSVNAMLLEMGREQLHEDTISGYIGHGAPQLVGQALGNNSTGAEREQALKFFLAYYEDHKMDSTCAYPGVPEALAHLATFPMAVLTNKPVRISKRILEGLGLAKYFRAVYGGNSFETKKPDPLRAQPILREFGATLAAAVNYGFGAHDPTAHPAGIFLHPLPQPLPPLWD